MFLGLKPQHSVWAIVFALRQSGEKLIAFHPNIRWGNDWTGPSQHGAQFPCVFLETGLVSRFSLDCANSVCILFWVSEKRKEVVEEVIKPSRSEALGDTGNPAVTKELDRKGEQRGLVPGLSMTGL